ncbi:Asp23/Gls24 family envelope stress response protein [Tissierella pigra]|uniref:Asp23/Gls24 family envelope stress response protein n=1 Tax=Tissierella pigra TaxID=2607614 RepID=A0A6N7XU50_9FIRM|nr:Asp23/Gls24 family envelope stress response protein [Tissierella pigra]MBU5426490.1 Asp23/Gls24 family envelope stress response protein [Tissierella pigra]MSU00064.1 Asp23/Gls24 family envelope stress response protein [Tissierella pigra]
MSAKTNTEYGVISIDDNVIATLAGISAMESYGIVGMASKNATDGLFELLKSDYLAKGIKVYTKDEKLTIDLHVILEYGVRISVVAENIIERVKFNIENLTGLKIDQINVHVQGIRVGK